jgi:hypothetical protein
VSAEPSATSAEAATEVARVHAVFRDINERIRDLNEGFDPMLGTGEWFCECADPSCVERLEMTLDEYEAIRRHPDRFPVIPGHEAHDLERVTHVVSRHSGYVVVETLNAEADVAAGSARRRKAGGLA